mgnify:FL=1
MSELLTNEILIGAIVTFLLFLLWLLAGPVKQALHKAFPLKRVANNPILAPHGLNYWETEAVFNPAAILDDDGVIHLLYRAMGSGGLSQIGHAKSTDGSKFERIYPYPVYQPTRGYGLPEDVLVPRIFDPVNYASGGGWGGCEDPRAVLIEDRVYMTYTAFEGWNNARISLTSIALQDLKTGKWRWKRPIYLSPPMEMHKNWSLFPEKIDGRYAILHGLAPKVLVEYVTNLEIDKNIESSHNHGGGGYNEPTRKGMWDKVMKGAGPPPLKTDLGWLVLYHAVEPGSGYKIGAMILDKDDPTKILYRAPTPILNPEMYYENDWKPGVVYASGAVIKDGEIHVYYGGGDKYVCAAHTNLNELLGWLTEHGKV